MGRTLLMYAAGFSRYSIIQYLLQHPYIVLNLKDDCDKTVLHHACRRSEALRKNKKNCMNQADMVYDLLYARATIDLQDHNGSTPLLIAADISDRAAVHMLLYCGASKS